VAQSGEKPRSNGRFGGRSPYRPAEFAVDHALDAVVEIFTWVGFGVGALVAGLALLAYLVDGTWVPVRVVVERDGEHPLVRWFDDDGDVNEAPLSEAQLHEIGAKNMVDAWSRLGSKDRMRLHRRSPVVRGLVLLASVFLGVGVLAVVSSIVLLFMRG
jgi:hypothetical protein